MECGREWIEESGGRKTNPRSFDAKIRAHDPWPCERVTKSDLRIRVPKIGGDAVVVEWEEGEEPVAEVGVLAHAWSPRRLVAWELEGGEVEGRVVDEKGEAHGVAVGFTDARAHTGELVSKCAPTAGLIESAAPRAP